MDDAKRYAIAKCYRQRFPKCRFIGIRYKNGDQIDGMFGAYWGQFFQNDRFAPLEALMTDPFKAEYEDWDAYIGLMKYRGNVPDEYFEYWIGMFVPEGSIVPEGYDYVDFDHDNAGICWLTGKENQLYGHEDEVVRKLTENGMSIAALPDGGCYCFERYGCPRFTTPDQDGNVTLDIGYFVK